jgi:hypothetical protein
LVDATTFSILIVDSILKYLRINPYKLGVYKREYLRFINRL